MIGFITQNPRGSLNPLQRVGDQIMFHFRVHSRGSSAGARKRTLELLERVGIGDAERRFRSYPHELSGGMAQRVLIAMALVTSPELLIADEPTTALDVTIQAQVLDLLAELRRDYGLTVILITHDLGVVANYCDTIHLMNAGELVEDAPALTFFEEATHPAAFALLAAQTGQYDRSRVRMRGFPPDLRKVPPGCRLQKRCPFASEVAGCQTVHPELMPVGLDHRVRCHRSDEVRLLVKNQQPEDQHERSDVHAT
jgi:oligopeptide/dipeptide ABC transporter ATP-binding protein